VIESRPIRRDARRSSRPEIETLETSVVHHAIPEHTSPLDIALDQSISYLAECVDSYMPPSLIRDFYLWGLNPANPQRDLWLQVIGTKQIVQFALQCMGDDYSPAEIAELFRYAAPMNAYLTFEVISDNVAFGLTDRLPNDDTYFLRAHLMHTFNQQLSKALAGEPIHGQRALANEQPIANRISAFNQSLSPIVHAKLAEAYRREHPQASMDELEYALYPMLIANFQSCVDVHAMSSSLHVGKLVQRGLYQRYRTADRVLHDHEMELSRVMSASTYSILIIPVIAYYLEGVAGIMGIRDRVPELLRDGLLFRALYEAARLTRLLNDMGTQVIRQQPEQRERLIAELRMKARGARTSNIHAFLRETTSEYGALLTRITKDVKHGEFNMMLYNLRHAGSLDAALLMFGERLHSFSAIYERGYARMWSYLQQLSERIGDDRLSKLIATSVIFHEKMYMHEYHKAQGEFAVGG
jgi:hypothetical protein